MQTRCEDILDEEFGRIGFRKPFWDNFCDSDAFYATASPEWVRDYYIKVIENKWFKYGDVRLVR